MNIYTLEVFIITGPVDEKFIKRNPVIARTIEVRGDQTLEELHNAIFKAFNRFDKHLYEFQVGGKGPNDPKARRYTLLESTEDSETAKHVIQTTLDVLKLKKDEVFGYVFDFGDEWWHQINVLAIENKPPRGTYPKVTKKVGTSPPQYMDLDDQSVIKGTVPADRKDN